MYIKIVSSILAVILLASPAFCDTKSQTSTISIAVQSAFSLEFYTDNNVLYSNAVPFTNVDPAKSMVYPDGRSEGDGKSDVGILCKTNAGSDWNLKVHVITTAPLTSDRILYYISQPYNRNTGGQSDGSLAQSITWCPFSDSPATVYTAGASDRSNMPYGTLTTLSLALNPKGLESGTSYTAVVVYTMTTTP